MLFTSGTKNVIGFCDNTNVKKPICLYSRNFLNIFNFTPLKAKIPDPCSVLSLPCCLLLQTNPNIREKSDEPNNNNNNKNHYQFSFFKVLDSLNT